MRVGAAGDDVDPARFERLPTDLALPGLSPAVVLSVPRASRN